jgi:putative ABC transport system permease protein
LRTLGVPIVAGRDITAGDERRAVDIGALLKDPELGKLLSGPGTVGPRPPGPEGYPVAVIDRQLAAILWPGSSPLGKTFSHGFLGVTYQVVGVIDEIRHGVLSDSHAPTLVTYLKLDSLADAGDLDVVLQVQDPQNGPLAEIGAVVREVFPDPASLRVETASAVLAVRTGRQRLVGTVVSYCALISVVLALVGVAGLVTYLIAHSQHELGIRAAVGATHQNLQRMLVRRAIVPVAIGVAVGALCSWQMMKLLSATLNITTPGTLVYVIGGLTLLGASGLAAVLATLRLRAINPAVALRTG